MINNDENKKLHEENKTGHWLTDRYFNEILHLKKINKQLREQLKELTGEEE